MDTAKNKRDFIRTEGGDINFNHPERTDVGILTIARQLSVSPRYNGCMYSYGNNGIIPYTVGQHSLLVAKELPAPLKLAGLLHDASEAFLGDILSPIKNFLPDYQEKEQCFEQVIQERFGISKEECSNPLIRKADKEVMATEMMYLGWKDIADFPTASVNVDPRPQQQIFKEFIEKLFELHPLSRKGIILENGKELPFSKALAFWFDEYETQIRERSQNGTAVAHERARMVLVHKGEADRPYTENEKNTQKIQTLGIFLDCFFDMEKFTQETINGIKNENVVKCFQNNEEYILLFMKNIQKFAKNDMYKELRM